MSEVMTAIERSHLITTDIEILRVHYADTLKHWWRRFSDNRERIRELYDERFCRMWEFYLLACENAFRNDDQMVFQLQFAKKLLTVPLTRDYMVDWERSHA
jgi:cyclopropane-fatty-acyl-phospholipid synthase